MLQVASAGEQAALEMTGLEQLMHVSLPAAQVCICLVAIYIVTGTSMLAAQLARDVVPGGPSCLSACLIHIHTPESQRPLLMEGTLYDILLLYIQ